MGLANAMKNLVRMSITAQFLSFLPYVFGFGFLGEVFGGCPICCGKAAMACMSIYEQRDGMALTSFSFSGFDGVGSWVGDVEGAQTVNTYSTYIYSPSNGYIFNSSLSLL